MNLYQGFGLVIESDIELPELPACNGTPDVRILRAPVDRASRAVGESDAYMVNRACAAFRISRGVEITVDWFPGARDTEVRSLLLGRVMALLFRQRGWLPLHASGVCGPIGVLLFAGPSGRGKSTTAAAFYSRGYDVFTDDLGVIRSEKGIWKALRCRPALKLREDAARLLPGYQPEAVEFDKLRFAFRKEIASDLISLGAIYILEEGQNVGIEKVEPLESVRLLGENSFFTRMRTPREVVATHFRLCAAVADDCAVFRLRRPQTLSALPAVIEAVEEHSKRQQQAGVG